RIAGGIDDLLTGGDRGRPSRLQSGRAISAALVAALAYGARCEHSDRLTDFGARPAGPAPSAVPPGGHVALLAAHGDRLLGR
ncbi:MAG: hypothetical protein ACYCU0_15245, partial [Solirubrobacteraceae bacterium]